MRRRGNENDYIQKGLIFHLDGRDSNGNTWQDRVGNITYTLYDCEKRGKGVYFKTYRSSYGSCNKKVTVSPLVGTIEVVADFKLNDETKYQMFWFGGDDSIGLYLRQDAVYCCTNSKAPTYKPLGDMPDLKTMSYNSNRAYCNLIEQFKNGEERAVSSLRNLNSFLGTPIGTAYIKATIYQVRVYNRILTKEEIMHNQHLDINLYNIPI